MSCDTRVLQKVLPSGGGGGRAEGKGVRRGRGFLNRNVLP